MLGDRSALKRTLEFSTPEDLMANFDRIPVVVTVITMFMSVSAFPPLFLFLFLTPYPLTVWGYVAKFFIFEGGCG